jgi:hypothetical protein
MAHHKRRHAGPFIIKRTGPVVASEAPKSVASSTDSSQLSVPRSFLLSSRPRGRISGHASIPGRTNTRGSVTLLEPLLEDSASMHSSSVAPSHIIHSHGRSRLPSWAQMSAQAALPSLSASLIPEEPHQVTLGGTFTEGHSSEDDSHALGSWHSAISAQELSDRIAPNPGSLFGGPSGSESASDGASQHDNPFLGSADSQSEYAAPARSIFSGSAGTRNHHRSAPRSLSGRVADVLTSLSSAASKSHRSSHGMCTAHLYNSLVTAQQSARTEHCLEPPLTLMGSKHRSCCLENWFCSHETRKVLRLKTVQYY